MLERLQELAPEVDGKEIVSNGRAGNLRFSDICQWYVW